MEWIRGGEIGHGSFSSINLAIPGKSTKLPHLPPLMAVKTSELCDSDTLRNEMKVLSRLGDCPRVIRCFGDQVRVENGVETYNLFLEYAAGSSLANEIKARGGRLPESEVRRHTRSVLEGLSEIHSRGFVHCDVKVQNILVFPPTHGCGGDTEVKIADFGLSKKAGVVVVSSEGRFEWRGTPLNMSPESINDNEYEAPSDVWALGCAVVEMVTGKAAWNHAPSMNVYALMMKIGLGNDIPQIPEDLSEEGRDFLAKCFVKDPKKRWTADVLLCHPFVAADSKKKNNNGGLNLRIELPPSPSPRCHFDFSSWDSSSTCTPHSSATTTPVTWGRFSQEQSNLVHADDFDINCCSSASDRIQSLATEVIPNWENSDGWIGVR